MAEGYTEVLERAKGKNRSGRKTEAAWSPQPTQLKGIESPVFELFYGGARGGGKTDFLLGDFLKGINYGPGHKGILFRRTYPEFDEIVVRSREIYPKLKGHFGETDRIWTFPSGATLKLRYLEKDSDVGSYQGHQYTWIGFDELTEWKSDYCYIYMFSCARSPQGLPVRIRATGNPGRPGHIWVKMRFIDAAAPAEVYRDPETGLHRTFIPAFLDDNPILIKKDPGYEARLKALPRHLYRAFRFGDWDVFIGQVFEEFRRERHVIKPVPMEPYWQKFSSLDWGYAKPYCLGWWSVTHDGRFIKYREWYGCQKGSHNVGIRKSSPSLAKESWEMSSGEGVKDIVLGGDCFSTVDDVPTVADNFKNAGWTIHRGDNSKGSRMNGLVRLHDLMLVDLDDGRPMILWFDTCKASIRTIPTLTPDDTDPEDIDTDLEDHPYDETRLAIMAPFAQKSRIEKPEDFLPGGYSSQQKESDDYDALNF